MAKKKQRKVKLAPSDQLAIARREWNKGNLKEALKVARVVHRQDPSHDTRSTLQQILLARGRELQRRSMWEPAQALVHELAALGDLVPEQQNELAKLRVLLGMSNGQEAAQLADDAEFQARRVDQLVLSATPGAGVGDDRATAEAVRGALKALELGNDQQAVELVAPIDRTSLFSDWKLLVRGLAGYYAGDVQRLTSNWSRLTPGRAPWRIAEPLALLAGAPLTDQTSESARYYASHLKRSQSGSLLGDLRKMKSFFDEVEIESRQFMSLAKRFFGQWSKSEPEIVNGVAEAIAEMLIDCGDIPVALQWISILPRTAKDPNFYRLRALVAAESRGMQAEEIEHCWDAYATDLETMDLESAMRVPNSLRTTAIGLVYGRLAADLLDLFPPKELTVAPSDASHQGPRRDDSRADDRERDEVEVDGDDDDDEMELDDGSGSYGDEGDEELVGFHRIDAKRSRIAEIAREIRAVMAPDIEANLRKSISLAPERTEHRAKLAWLLADIEKYEEADKAYHDLAAHAGDDVEVLLDVAQYFAGRRMWDSSKKTIQQVRQLQPRNETAANHYWNACIGAARQAVWDQNWKRLEKELREADELAGEDFFRTDVSTAIRIAAVGKRGDLAAVDAHLKSIPRGGNRTFGTLLILDGEFRRAGVTASSVLSALQDRLGAAAKARKTSESAGLSVQYLMQADSDATYPGQQRHSAMVDLYLAKSSRLKWNRELLKTTCYYLKPHSSSHQLLLKLANRGRKLFPDDPHFAMFQGMARITTAKWYHTTQTVIDAFNAALRLDARGPVRLSQSERNFCQFTVSSMGSSFEYFNAR